MTECTNVRTVLNRRQLQCLQYVFTVSTVRVGTVVRVRVPTVACQIASDCKLQNLDYLSRRRENRRSRKGFVPEILPGFSHEFGIPARKMYHEADGRSYIARSSPHSVSYPL